MTSFLRMLAAIVFAGLMVSLLGPAPSIESARPGLDKIAHFVAFGLILWSLGVLVRRVPRWALAAATITLGGLIEVVQGMTGRDAEWLDWAADAAGVTVALFVWLLWRRFQPQVVASLTAHDGKQAATGAFADVRKPDP